MVNPLVDILALQQTIILDGALATELERRGYNLDDPLWSARVLLEKPNAIRQLHLDYLEAGADVIITASYQATFEGFRARGYTERQAKNLLEQAVELAVSARDEYWHEIGSRTSRPRPLVAASIGPYGAFLANGAEYTGDYDLDEAGLKAWHAPRWRVLAETRADLLACETVPSFSEGRALAALLAETPGRAAWLSFTCRSGRELSDGTPLEEVAAYFNDYAQIIALGVNCTHPRFIPELITVLQQATTKPIVVYPNSGEIYDPSTRRWIGITHAEAFGTAAREWRKLGAAAIGGCCRTSPAHIRALSSRLK